MSKRKRISENGSAAPPDLHKHELFTQWATARGVVIGSVKPAQLPGRGLGLITTKRVKEGERILFIPEKAMFKPDSVRLRKENLKNISPQAQLALSALLSFHATDSPYRVWSDTWPTPSDFASSMPMCWSPHEQQRLPASVQQPLERQLADYTKDISAVQPYLSAHGLTEDQFKYFWLIVNSRSFHWKPAGMRTGCMVMCPFIDYLNHGPSGGGTCQVTMSAKGYEVVADRRYEPGEEVLATYGAHSNDKLLVHYGFVCDGEMSGDDSIPLDEVILPPLEEGVRTQLRDVGFLGGYVLLPGKRELCFKTHVAVRAVLLTCNEWEYFVGSGEDLGEDWTGRVEDWVRELLKGWREEVVRGVERESGVDGKAMVRERWKQILEAIDAFCG